MPIEHIFTEEEREHAFQIWQDMFALAKIKVPRTYDVSSLRHPWERSIPERRDHRETPRIPVEE